MMGIDIDSMDNKLVYIKDLLQDTVKYRSENYTNIISEVHGGLGNKTIGLHFDNGDFITKEQFDNLYVKDNIVVHCDTKEKALHLLRIADSFGYRWRTNDKYLNKDLWHVKKSDTCYNIKNGEYSSYKSYEKSHKYKIIEYKPNDSHELTKTTTSLESFSMHGGEANKTVYNFKKPTKEEFFKLYIDSPKTIIKFKNRASLKYFLELARMYGYECPNIPNFYDEFLTSYLFFMNDPNFGGHYSRFVFCEPKHYMWRGDFTIIDFEYRKQDSSEFVGLIREALKPTIYNFTENIKVSDWKYVDEQLINSHLSKVIEVATYTNNNVTSIIQQNYNKDDNSVIIKVHIQDKNENFQSTQEYKDLIESINTFCKNAVEKYNNKTFTDSLCISIENPELYSIGLEKYSEPFEYEVDGLKVGLVNCFTDRHGKWVNVEFAFTYHCDKLDIIKQVKQEITDSFMEEVNQYKISYYTLDQTLTTPRNWKEILFNKLFNKQYSYDQEIKYNFALMGDYLQDNIFNIIDEYKEKVHFISFRNRFHRLLKVLSEDSVRMELDEFKSELENEYTPTLKAITDDMDSYEEEVKQKELEAKRQELKSLRDVSSLDMNTLIKEGEEYRDKLEECDSSKLSVPDGRIPIGEPVSLEEYDNNFTALKTTLSTTFVIAKRFPETGNLKNEGILHQVSQIDLKSSSCSHSEIRITADDKVLYVGKGGRILSDFGIAKSIKFKSYILIEHRTWDAMYPIGTSWDIEEIELSNDGKYKPLQLHESLKKLLCLEDKISGLECSSCGGNYASLDNEEYYSLMRKFMYYSRKSNKTLVDTLVYGECKPSCVDKHIIGEYDSFKMDINNIPNCDLILWMEYFIQRHVFMGDFECNFRQGEDRTVEMMLNGSYHATYTINLDGSIMNRDFNRIVEF